MAADCDECGKRGVEIKRTEYGHRYCATCYAREFPRRQCPSCGRMARLPRRDLHAICRQCRSRLPCVRCGRTDAPTGAQTQYGRVCNACLPYFKDEEPCERCGRLSRQLSRARRFGGQLRLCQRCRQADYATCAACGRYRPLTVGPSGQLVCERCRQEGEVTCSVCGGKMPAGAGKRCSKCYWTQLFEKRLNMDVVAFDTAEMGTHFRAFGEQLLTRRGANWAASALHRYFRFFRDIECRWRSIPRYDDLLAHFTADGLRRYRLAVQWMDDRGLIVIAAQVREEATERRRLNDLLSRFESNSVEYGLLEGYYKLLEQRLVTGRTSIRSVRLALAQAAALLDVAKERGRLPPDQIVLNHYLRCYSGRRAAISGFVVYLREKHHVEIVLPKANLSAVRRQRTRRLKKDILALIRNGADSERRWLSVALAYFHRLPRNIGHRVAQQDIVETDDGVYVLWRGQRYFIPAL